MIPSDKNSGGGARHFVTGLSSFGSSLLRSLAGPRFNPIAQEEAALKSFFKPFVRWHRIVAVRAEEHSVIVKIAGGKEIIFHLEPVNLDFPPYPESPARPPKDREWG